MIPAKDIKPIPSLKDESRAGFKQLDELAGVDHCGAALKGF